MRRDVKGLSKIIWVVVILCSITFGALLSYVWVMGNFYAEPENTTILVVTNAVFPIDHANEFNVTVLNTSNSISFANISRIYVTPEGYTNAVNVTDTSPDKLPIIIDRGTSKTITCQADWGQFAGYNLLIHFVTPNATVTSAEFPTTLVRLTVEPFFNPAVSVGYFNATVASNSASAINVTVSDILLDNTEINNTKAIVYPTGSNTTELFPTKLAPGASILVQCFADWTGDTKPTVKVETTEGYYAQETVNASAAVSLLITDVTFNVTNPSANDFTITLSNSESSATNLNVTELVLITGNNTKYTISTDSFGIMKNQTVTREIVWPWKNYRGKDLNLTAYTRQGFKSTSEIVTTPKNVVFGFEPTFNLTGTGTFKINVTNEACSLKTINVTSIKFNDNATTITPTSDLVTNGTTQLFNATWNWANLRGQNVTITVTANDTSVNRTITLPKVDLKLAASFNKSLGIPYGNVTIISSSYSNQTVAITQITFTVNSTIYRVDGNLTNPTLTSKGISLGIGKTVTVVCPWNWANYHNQEVTVTVQTEQGFTVSKTFLIP